MPSNGRWDLIRRLKVKIIPEHIDILFPFNRSLNFSCSRDWSLAVAAICEQPFPLHHYCGIGYLPYDASAMNTSDCHMVWFFSVTVQPHMVYIRHKKVQLPHWELADYPFYFLGLWSSTWEVTNSTVVGSGSVCEWVWMQGPKFSTNRIFQHVARQGECIGVLGTYAEK